MSRFENLEFDSDHAQRQSSLRANTGADPFFAQAEEAFENGRFEQALRLYGRALEFRPGEARAWTGQVRMLIELGEFEEARVWADKALDQFPAEADLLAAKAVALARGGDDEGAIAYSDSSLETRASTPYVWLARADVLLARKEKRADYCLEKALALAGQSWFVLWLCARILSYYRQAAQALKLLRSALALEPGRAVLWLQAGQCQLALGLTDQARNSFVQSRELDPSCDVRSLLESTHRTPWATCFLRRLLHWRQS